MHIWADGHLLDCESRLSRNLLFYLTYVIAATSVVRCSSCWADDLLRQQKQSPSPGLGTNCIFMCLLLILFTGMNAEVDEAAEERKGGAGHIGKMLLSAGDKQVCYSADGLTGPLWGC